MSRALSYNIKNVRKMVLQWSLLVYLYSVILLSCGVTSQTRLRNSDVLIVNKPVTVPNGRTVYVDPVNHVRITVRPGDTCTLTVLDTFNLSYRDGRLNGDTFPCKFGPFQVQYTHFGGNKFSEEKIRMLLRYDSATETLIIPFSLVFKITNKPLEIVRRTIPVAVDMHMGISSPIDYSKIQFEYDRERTFCKVSVISRASGLPQYGYLLNDTRTLQNLDCDAFLVLGVRYKHHAQANAPNLDYIPMMVKILNDKGAIVKQEYFQMRVNIKSGHENTRPEPSRNALFVMDSINQFVMTAITPEIISAYDEQTPSDELLYNITLPLGPGEGMIVNTDNRDIPIVSFFQNEINDLKIAYKPPSSDSSINRMFQFGVTIVDRDGLTSDPIPVMIVVEPMNTYAPVVTTNMGVQLIEGQSRSITTSMLDISDEDNLQDVKIYHIDGLRHGHLILPSSNKFFTPKDLKSGRIVYQHDDSDTYSDNIIFRMTDGTHEVEFLFPITIYPKDDHAPTLNVNTGFEIQKNEVVEINQFLLSATDFDSGDFSIFFQIQPPYSKEGVIMKRQFQIPEDVENWIFQEGIYEKSVREFTQKDIIDGKIFYKHIGGHNSEIVVDKISFILIDSGDPPNQSSLQELEIKILPIDDIPPYLHPNIKLQFEVEEHELFRIKQKNLRYSDYDTNHDRDIKYVIQRPPFDTYNQGPPDAGRLCYCDSPRRPITKFTQAEINHRKICYNPPATDLGIATRIIQFDFSVEDASNNVLPEQRYTIVIKPVDNQPPIITNAGVVLFENEEVVLTPDILDVQDHDTNIDNLIIIVTRIPQHGSLYKHTSILQVGDKFNRNDIVKGNIIYKNLGENIEVSEDQFSLEITDGIHYVPITFKIMIRPTDDEPAQFEGQGEDGKLFLRLEVNEGQPIRIGQDKLRLSDPDTDVMSVTYIVKAYPSHGNIMRNGRRTDHFTQQDIIQRKVTYEHIGEIGRTQITDSFELILSENSKVVLGDGSLLNDILAMVTVFPVDNISPTVTIGGNLDVLEAEKARILPSHIDVYDKDSNINDTLCTILTQPKNGYIENIAPLEGSEKTRMGMPISAFAIRDLRLGNILYVQSLHSGVEPRRDDFTFQCTDGVNLSPQNRLSIVIHPSNDEVPEVHIREFIGSEGMDISIDLPILNAVDKDEPADTLYFIITKSPSHGKIIQQSRLGDHVVSNFTLADISQSSTIVYEHDDSETQSDYFDFVLTDGKYNVTKSIPIIIFPVDDETPRLSINNGLEIIELGETKTITADVLQAEDLDSSIGNITFIIRRVPQQGYLVKRYHAQDKNLTLGSNFTQIDINNKFVSYVHTGIEPTRDMIKFDITDGINPLVDRYFYISVKGMDVIYPEVINRGVELPQRGFVTITTDILSGTDLNSPDEDLKFIITRAPKHGHLEYVSRVGVPIITFTQLDLAANRVRYIHRSDDEVKMDSFEFEMTDGHNPVSRTFRIALTDVDNKRPVLMFTTLRVREGGSKLITPFELKAVDTDTADGKIIFKITQVPLHGNLLFNVSRIVSQFTLEDLNKNMIQYQHDGTETLSDSFTFTVTDGTHSQFFIPSSNIPTRKPQEMDIEIIPVDNGIPQMSVNLGATSLAPIDGGLGFQFTSRILRSDDQDSPVDNLRYTLTVAPEHGYIRHIQLGDGAVNTWTQGDIDRQQIQYILNNGDNATSDRFFFKVADNGGNVLANQPFHLNWGWLSFQQSSFTVNETQEVLEVTLLRRGYLAETCFVSVNVTDQTAMVGKDVSRQFPLQVQFNPGQTEKTWRLPLRDDVVYEGEETLILQLTDPVSAILEYPDVAMVTIVDPEDESTVFFSAAEYHVNETVSQLNIPIHRTGDLSQELVVICSTVEDTAKGTPVNKVQSFSDYITRPADHNSNIRFDPGQDKKYCTVTVIDDSLYEEEEKFKLLLSQPIGGKIGNNQSDVLIQPDPSDEPVFFFDQSTYTVDESVGLVEVKVWKTGTDLSLPSSVTVRSRQTTPTSAEAGQDYVAVIRILDFAPREMTKTLQVVILDDLGQPHLEGAEKFELHLRRPVGGSLGEPSITTIVINDSISDLPQMQFGSDQYEVLESEKYVVAMVTRSGDINHESRVRCYTRQLSAQVELDYIERPDTNASFVFFKRGERDSECRVKLVNDGIHEGEESFRLVLGTPDSLGAGGATLGGQNTARVTILDPEDKPVIKFEQTRYTVNEPIIKGDITVLRVPVIRLGDTTGESAVRVSTSSGSASAGRDFNAYSRVLELGPGVERVYAEIEINYDGERETSEMFSLQLSRDIKHIAEVQHNNRASIYIEEKSELVDVIFPVPPIVVSLHDLDSIGQTFTPPVQGYPLVCVSPCNPKHPEYPKVARLCLESGINDTYTKYRWRVGPASDDRGVYGGLRDLETNTFFTTTRYVTLDSIYFGPGSHVQCYARAVNEHGDPGKELGSLVITVDTTEGMCLSRIPGSVGADPFTAKLRYTGTDDQYHPNTVRLTIKIPHTDGMLPLISTTRLSNFGLAVSADGFRLGQHRCSNMLNKEEVTTKYGFITNQTRSSQYAMEVEPYQYSSDLRPEKTLRFYRNLDLNSCLWTFETYYDMSELVSECGGLVETDAQRRRKDNPTEVMNSKQSYVSLRVPLYVSYLYHSSQPGHTWTNYDMNTYLNLKFVYQTSILWKEGVKSQADTPGVQGYLYPSSMRIQDDGRLVVDFRTEAKFRGLFVMSYQGHPHRSTVKTVDHPELSFSLSPIRSDSTYDQPEQYWEMISAISIKDYSGDYKISLVPCTVRPSKPYSLPIICQPGEQVTFDLPVRFQQVSDPVAANFSLNTQFHLIRKRELWLTDSSMGIALEEDTAFAPGDMIYGRVDVDPVQSLGGQFNLNIEKVFMCSGQDGFIPTYNPDQREYGCVTQPGHLDRVLRIIDAGAPYTVDESYNGMSFNAQTAAEDKTASALYKQPGADGFSFDSSPLFQVDTGKPWFLHIIYTIRGKSTPGFGKRSTNLHHHVRRALSEVDGVGKQGKGTNMAPLILDFDGESYDQGIDNGADKMQETPQGQMSLIAVLIGVGVLLLICIFVLVIFVIRYRRKRTSPPPTPTGTITVMSTTMGQTRVISNSHYMKTADHSEV